MEEIQLEKGDMKAMFIALFLTVGLPLAAMLGTFYGLIYLLFIR